MSGVDEHGWPVVQNVWCSDKCTLLARLLQAFLLMMVDLPVTFYLMLADLSVAFYFMLVDLAVTTLSGWQTWL